MKKQLLLALSLCYAFAESMPPMPPMVPNLPINGTPAQTSTLPKSCEVIPPMIYKLPPPLENALKECNNDLKKPTEALVKQKFGSQIQNITVNAIEEFTQVYAVSFVEKSKKTERFCNETLTLCFEQKPVKK